MNKNNLLDFTQGSCKELAEQIFFRMAGIKDSGKKAERMRRDAMEAREAVEPRIKARASYAFYENVTLCGRELTIGDQTLTCSAFEQVRKDTVQGVYVYALSAGDFSFPQENVMRQLYADLWGSAFAEAVRLLLVEELQQKARLSDGFGPGFYGMDVVEMTRMAHLVDLGPLDIQVKDSGILLPLKSCGGLYLCVNEGYEVINNACRSCRGNHTSCQLCNVRGGI